MLDAALITNCADPSLTPALVEQFVAAAGSPDPLAITIKSGGRLILVPKPNTPAEAMDIIRDNVGRAVVRVGVTQFPAGVGVKDASALKPELVDACENLRMGTKMFAKIMRIVAKWYGNPTSKDVMPQIFEDAVYSWKSGQFEGVSVFQADDLTSSWKMPGTAVPPDGAENDGGTGMPVDAAKSGSEDEALQADSPEDDASKAGIRIDMSRVGGQ